MNFLHRQFDLQPEDVVEVSLNSRANVLLLDSHNFSEYERKSAYHCYGGHAETTQVRLSPPRAGRWHLVVDLGGYPGSVRADIRLLRQGKVLQKMSVKKSSGPTRQFSPVRIAPLEELNAYTVHEYELDIIAAGSPATLAFNFAIALISVGVSFILTLTTTTIQSNRLFYSSGHMHELPVGWCRCFYLLVKDEDERQYDRPEDQKSLGCSCPNPGAVAWRSAKSGNSPMTAVVGPPDVCLFRRINSGV